MSEDYELLDDEAEYGCFDDPRAIDELRRSTFEGIGPEHGIGILYGVGLNQGLMDGLSVAKDFDASLEQGPLLTGGPIPMVFIPGGLEDGDRFRGELPSSVEADLHLDRYPAAQDPICLVTAGYASGWYTALLGEPYLVKETACRGRGDATCEFEAQPLHRWEVQRDTWALQLLPYLDFERMREAALEKLDGLDGEEVEGSMMGGFDPMSPAVHVWGSVMVLPYSGRQDSEAALDAIQEDLGPRQLQVVVVDVTGAEIDELEATGLLQLIDTLTSFGLETILVGLSDQAADDYVRPGSCAAMPLRAQDITAGISLAFQISCPPSIVT